MKRILLAGTFALAAASPTLAADLPSAAPPPAQAPATYVPAPAPVYNWSGIYVGVNAGYGFGDSEWSPPGLASSGDFNVVGGLVGGTIGANFQSGQFVFGIEGDGDWADLDGTVAGTVASCPVATACTFETTNNWLATVRGRVGYAFDRVLVYGTAGGAFGDVKATLSGTGITTGSTDSTEWGWTAGAGVEYAITENITAKVEYLFVDLSNGSCSTSVCTLPAASTPVSFDASLVRAGLNFKFNPF